MNVIIRRSEIDGKIIAPPSKSFTHRAVVAASLAKGKSMIYNYLSSDDTEKIRTIAAKAVQEMEPVIKIIRELEELKL